MRCHEICENLSAYIDGMLEQSDASLVERHLESCPGCKSEYDDLLVTVELIRGLPEVKPPPGFRDELKERMITGGFIESAPKPVSRRLFAGRWVGMVAAAAVIFITVGVTALWYEDRGMQLVPELKEQMAGETEPGQSEVATGDAGAGGSSEQAEDMMALRVADNAGDLREESASSTPGPESDTNSGVRETQEKQAAPAAELFKSPAGAARDEGMVPQDSGNIENNLMFTAITDEAQAARSAAPLGMGDGPGQVAEYSLTLQVDDKRKTMDLVGGVAAKHDGFAEALRDNANHMLITVPFYNAQTLVEEVGQLGTVTDRQSEQKDMSTEIKELEKNISEFKAREQNLAEKIKSNQADQTTANELAAVREQIAGLQAQLTAINTSVIMNKVEVNFIER